MNCFEHVNTDWPELTGNYVTDLGAAMDALRERAEDLQSLGHAMMTMGMEHPAKMLLRTALLMARARPHFFAILSEVTAPAMKHTQEMSAMMLQAALAGAFNGPRPIVDDDDNGPSDSDIAEMQADDWIASQEEAQIAQMIEDQQIEAAVAAQEEDEPL